jgi:hypothetical protein
MKNWKTTLGGALAALGIYLVNSQVGILNLVGQIMQAVGVFFVGYAAVDAPAETK